jgi:hypothetical protein
MHIPVASWWLGSRIRIPLKSLFSCLVFVVLVAASATDWSLVQRSPTVCVYVCVCVCVWHINLKTRLPRPGLSCSTTVKGSIYFVYCDGVLLIVLSYCTVRKSWSNSTHAWTGPQGCRRLRRPEFKTIGTWRL